MIETTTATHGIAFGGAEAGCSFARVENLDSAACLCSCDRLRCQSGRAGESLDPVEGNPLGPQQCGQGAADDSDDRSLRHLRAIGDVRLEHCAVCGERGLGEADATDDAACSRDHLGLAIPHPA